MLIPSLGQAVSNNDDATIASEVLRRYFTALSQGDINAMKSLMAGSLLDKRILLLNNSDYPAYLQRTYGLARFSIDSIEALNSTDVSAVASIAISQDNVFTRQFLLRKEATPDSGEPFRIYSESDPNFSP
jgi:hypothetical protein